MKYLYQIANALPGFLEERGFTAEPAKGVRESKSDLQMCIRDSMPSERAVPCEATLEDLYLFYFPTEEGVK